LGKMAGEKHRGGGGGKVQVPQKKGWSNNREDKKTFKRRHRVKGFLYTSGVLRVEEGEVKQTNTYNFCGKEG